VYVVVVLVAVLIVAGAVGAAAEAVVVFNSQAPEGNSAHLLKSQNIFTTEFSLLKTEHFGI
jgi:uncharacterized membrane protein YciS (DUF1049 family)